MTHVMNELACVPDIAGPILSDDNGERLLSISEMAEVFDVSLRTLRFYEEKGLLQPIRQGARRFYSGKEVSRMRVILQAKRIGLTLIEIRKVVGIVEGGQPRLQQLRDLRKICAHQEKILHEQQSEIAQQIKEMGSVASSLDELIHSKTLAN